MVDIRHDMQILVSIAKLDALLNELKSELSVIPGKKSRAERILAEADQSERAAMEHFETMKKERRSLEANLEDRGELLKKYKTQLMGIKTNREYTALLKEIETIEKEIDEKEEKLLILMDEIEEQAKESKAFSQRISAEREKLRQEKTELEEREKFLNEEINKLQIKKPAFLSELEVQLKRRYERLMLKLRDFAVTNVLDEVCQGCFSKIPSQTANEVKKNDRIVSCEGCGRILVHY